MLRRRRTALGSFALNYISEGLHLIFMSPHHGGGHTVFSVDPVGVGVISLLNGQILAKLTQIYHWEGEKC